ncbi:hypothetical protein N665_0674s0022 [Sinapis alba]|nr:hypothetical protein N665_0674s0022 [Sinapis alba]
MAKSLSMLMFVFMVVSFISHTTYSKEFDRYSLEVPEDVKISPMPDFDIHIEYLEPPFEADSPTMEYKLDLGGYYSVKELDFLQACLKKLDSDCGSKILMDMNDKTTTQLTNECCRDLLKIGRGCHLIVAELMSVNMDYYNSASKAVSKSKYTWKDCVHRVESHIGAPQESQEFDQYSLEVPEDVKISPMPDFDIHDESPEPPSEADSPTMEYKLDLGGYYSVKELDFLQACLKKLDSDCGSKILMDMNDKTTTQLTTECCRDLLKIGRGCHLIVAELMSVNMDYYNSASKAVPKSKYTWKDCVHRVESHIGAPISLE